MRIALFHNLPSGGAKRTVLEWARRLANDEIDVFTLTSADHNYCDLRPFVRSHRVYNFESRRLFASPWGRLNQWQRWRDLQTMKRLCQQISQEIDEGGYDVVLVNGCLYTVVPSIVLYLRTPAVFYLHEPFGKGFVRRIERPYLRSRKWRKALDRFDPLISLHDRHLEMSLRQGLLRATRLLANSAFTRECIQASFGVEPLLSRLGVDCEVFRPIAGICKEGHVLSVGELTPRKGFDFLIESLGNIEMNERPPLVLACNRIDQDERKHLCSLARQAQVELRILTNLETEDLALEYNKASLCVYAPVAEALGLVPLEAMACGTAVIGVREGGVRETVVDGYSGLLVDRNPRHFAMAIRRLLSNRTLAATYGRQGRELVLHRWTWEASTADLRDHLERCTRDKNPSLSQLNKEPETMAQGIAMANLSRNSNIMPD